MSTSNTLCATVTTDNIREGTLLLGITTLLAIAVCCNQEEQKPTPKLQMKIEELVSKIKSSRATLTSDPQTWNSLITETLSNMEK